MHTYQDAEQVEEEGGGFAQSVCGASDCLEVLKPELECMYTSK